LLPFVILSSMKNYYCTLIIIICSALYPVAGTGQVAPGAIDNDLLAESIEEVLGVQQAAEWIQKTIPAEVKLSVDGKLKIKQSLPDTLHVGKVKTDNGVWYIIPDIAPSKSEKYSYVLYLNENKEIVDVDVLEYRENYGYEIDYSFFREQFHGKSDPREVRFKRSIQNISGATISARSLTYSVRDLLTLMQKMELN